MDQSRRRSLCLESAAGGKDPARMHESRLCLQRPKHSASKQLGDPGTERHLHLFANDLRAAWTEC